MKYFVGFIVGSAVMAAITRPARTKALYEALGIPQPAKAEKK